MRNHTIFNLLLQKNSRIEPVFTLSPHLRLSVYKSEFSKLFSHVSYSCQGGSFYLKSSKISQIYNAPVIVQKDDSEFPYGSSSTTYSGTDFRKVKTLVFLVGTNDDNMASEFEIIDCSISNCFFDPKQYNEYASIMVISNTKFLFQDSSISDCISYQPTSQPTGTLRYLPLIYLGQLPKQANFQTISFDSNNVIKEDDGTVLSATPVLFLFNGTFKGKQINITSDAPIDDYVMHFDYSTGNRLNYINFVSKSRNVTDGVYAVYFENCQSNTISNIGFIGFGSSTFLIDSPSSHYIVLKNMCFEDTYSLGPDHIGIDMLITSQCPLDPNKYFSSVPQSSPLSRSDKVFEALTIVVFIVLFCAIIIVLIGFLFWKKGNFEEEHYSRLQNTMNSPQVNDEPETDQAKDAISSDGESVSQKEITNISSPKTLIEEESVSE